MPESLVHTTACPPIESGHAPTGKKILFVLEHYHPYVGGVETLFRNLTEALVKHGYQVTVVTRRLPGTVACERVGGVTIRRVWTPPWGGRYLFMPLAIPTVLAEARQADLIHTTTYTAAVPARLASVFRRKPVVITVHEVFADQWHQLLGVHPLVGHGFRAFESAILHLRFAHYVCDSIFTRDRLVKTMPVAPSQVSVAYPAVDYAFWNPHRHNARPLRAELGLAATTPLYLYFGRPGVSKGVEYLLQAARQIRVRVPASHLVLLLGPDPQPRYQAIMRLHQELKLAGHATILKPVPRAELPSYLLAANCVVVPSVSEGFGYSAVEAASLGCPVISTTGHSVEEVVGNGAVLVPPRDVTRLADAIEQQLLTPGERRPLPPRYDLDAHLAAVLAVYQRVWQATPCPAGQECGS